MARENCPFCAADSRVVLEGKLAFALLSNPRKVPGHVLVIPKRHVEEPWELTMAERADIGLLLDSVTQRLIKAKLGDGVDIRQNYRPFAQKGKLSVRHIHFHAVPRMQDDYIYQVSEKYDTELFADLDPSEAKEVTKMLT
ncbi:HIT domain-containing protein [Candidatus Saccharibacteria bacterium]|nr:HIT domain-containing protein [Candidatus Saccharibacteria bacterium]